GRIGFDENGLRGEGVTGDYLGRPVSGFIETVEDANGHTRARLNGHADAAYIARHLHNAGLLASDGIGEMPILARIQGEAPWQATIDVLEQHASGEAPVVLRVESNLESAALALPAPFAKPVGEPLPIVVEAHFADRVHREMRLTMGGLASGVFDLRDGDGGYRMHRANVHLGGGTATLPKDARLTITGRVAHTDLGDWSNLALSPQEGTSQADALPTRVDVAVERLAVLGAEFDAVHITASSTDEGGWRASIVGDQLDGQITVPTRSGDAPVTARFDRLTVSPLPEGDANPPDPRGLPPVHFSCRQCTFGDTSLSDIELVTSKIPEGMRIDSLRLRSHAFDASAGATWTVGEDDAQRTRLDARLASPDLGNLLTALGHKGDATRGGVTDLTLTAAWDGSPSDFDLERLDGVLHFRTGEGTLTDIERGTAGRLFGLLVVPDLPRRLKGDFSDLFEKGFVYREIEGTFNIERGNAYTNNLTLDGSLARINIAGRTGLVAEDYDQLITVTPKLSESLPLMPIWLVEKAFQKELFNKLFAYQYTVTGSWNAPSVTRVRIQHDPSSGRS
ncbi:MAG: AsmA-like C-terminal region-containing protein, partial [Gammaproteobacteria bacterium]|nr:AsmA-like C-terminal region-containing protein [Gammaproteobacteria bacterium]